MKPTSGDESVLVWMPVYGAINKPTKRQRLPLTPPQKVLRDAGLPVDYSRNCGMSNGYLYKLVQQFPGYTGKPVVSGSAPNQKKVAEFYKKNVAAWKFLHEAGHLINWMSYWSIREEEK